MKKSILLLLIIISCNTKNPERVNVRAGYFDNMTDSISQGSIQDSQQLEIKKTSSCIIDNVSKLNAEGQNICNYEKIFPGITDTIIDKRIFIASKIGTIGKTNTTISILNNTGTFEQMFLCTHNKDNKLVDSYYIGKSTMWDGSSHVIEKEIVNDSTLKFHHCDFGYNTSNEIDTIKYYSEIVLIQNNGMIKEIK